MPIKHVKTSAAPPAPSPALIGGPDWNADHTNPEINDVAGLTAALAAKPDTSALATVATSGQYSDLAGRPTLGTVAALSGPGGTSLFLRADNTYAAPPTAAPPAWGSITGLLSNQTDLQTALGTKANTSSLATVATSGQYADLAGKPALFSGAYADLTGKPTLFSGAYADLTGKPTLGTVAALSYPGGTTLYLRADGTWATPAGGGGGSGDVVGPASAVNNRVAFFDGTTGKLIKDSGLTLAGTNTGDQTSVTGNAGTATTLQTARTIDGVSFNGSANITVIAPATVAATAKTTPVDADVMPLADSAASNVLKKVTWANIKATLKAYFDTLYSTFVNPMTTAGDIIIGGTSGAPARLAATTDGYVLTLASGVPVWSASSGGGFSNPMTTAGDLIVGGSAGAAGRLAAGTAAYVLTSNGAGVAPTWQAVPGGGGLVNFTEAVSTATPNATKPVVSLVAKNAATDVDAAFIAKGNGAHLVQVPDNTAAGGNKRGGFAVDFQRVRASAGQVATGAYSILMGTNNCTVSGTRAGIYNSDGSTCAGTSSAVVASDGSTCAGNNSFVAGGFSSTSAGTQNATVGGQSHVNSGQYCGIIGGEYASTRGLRSVLAFAAGQVSNPGDQQRLEFIQRTSTSNATPKSMATDGGTASATTGMVLQNNSSVKFFAEIVARDASTGDTAGWNISGTVKRRATASTVALVGTPTVTAQGADAGAATWAVAAIVNTTLGSLELQVTGAAATVIRWTSHVNFVENSG